MEAIELERNNKKKRIRNASHWKMEDSEKKEKATLYEALENERQLKDENSRWEALKNRWQWKVSSRASTFYQEWQWEQYTHC